VLLKIYVHGYLNRLQSSRRLERETQRNVGLMWLTGRLTPDFKTIADFRRDQRAEGSVGGGEYSSASRAPQAKNGVSKNSFLRLAIHIVARVSGEAFR
jgi:hypothetical protein